MGLDIRVRINRNIFLYLAIALSILVADLITKEIAFSMIINHGGTIDFGTFLSFTRVYNKGISFGMFNNMHHGAYIISTVTMLSILLILYIMVKSKNHFCKTQFSMIIGGAVANLYDRITIGSVRDFIDFHVYEYHWPAFNVADASICIGAMLVIANDLLFGNKTTIKEK